MTVATSEASPTEVELVLREAVELSGLGSTPGFFRVSDPVPRPEAAGVLVSLVDQCVREWPRDLGVQLWHIPFEGLLAAPLRVLDHLLPGETKALETLEAFIACIDLPLLEHERLLADTPVPVGDIVGTLAQLKLAQHRATIDALRQQPRIEIKEGWITVEVFSDDFRMCSLELHEKAQRLEAVIDEIKRSPADSRLAGEVLEGCPRFDLDRSRALLV
jgi:hypothetical protein